MQLKFITLTLSAVLAISALSANALPTGKPDTTDQDIATQAESKNVNPDAQSGKPVQKDVGGLDGLNGLSGVTDLLDELLDTVEDLLEIVTDDLLKNILELVKQLLTGNGSDEGLVEELLELVKGLLKNDKPGKFAGAKNADVQESHTPTPDNDEGNLIESILSLVTGLLDGNSAKDSGVENVLDLLQDLLDGILNHKNGSGAEPGSNADAHGADAAQCDEAQ